MQAEPKVRDSDVACRPDALPLLVRGIDIPAGAVMLSAYIQFQTDEVRIGAASPTIRGEDVVTAHYVIFVGGKFSSNIWVLDHNGALLDTITLLGSYGRPGGAGVKVTDFELAPSSDPNDDPAHLSLYVTDYGADQVNDGRLFEIDLGSYFFV